MKQIMTVMFAAVLFPLVVGMTLNLPAARAERTTLTGGPPAASAPPGERWARPDEGYVIKNVNVIVMTAGNEIIRNADVVVRGDKIISINGPAPEDAKIIDGTGKWLIPGLIDMHVHNLSDANIGRSYPTRALNISIDTQDFMLLYVANGVTTAFELSGRVEHFGQRTQIAKGEVIGPRIALAFLIDGGDSGNAANTPSDGRQSVRLARAQGYEFIKVYSNLDEETFAAIIDEADKQGMKVVGHIPTAFKAHTEDAFAPHLGLVAHAEEFAKQTEVFTEAEARRFAAIAKANGAWVIPNLSNLVRIAAQARSLDAVQDLPSFQYVHPLMQSKWLTANQYNKGSNPRRIAYYDQLVAFHRQLALAFRDAGVPMLAGTDAGTSGVVWGFSLHDELELLVDAGLTPVEALRAATIQPATWLEIEDRIGSVEAGKFADLVLLDANPLTDISNTRKIAGVFFDGRWLSRDGSDAMLAELAIKNARPENRLEWNKLADY
ncbi:MAG: amidohydrolase family protein [Parvularculaceae bacterium]